jgi:hypothetical protein
MGSCPSCGASSFFGISTKQCVWCGRIVCSKCVPQWHGNFSIKTQMEQPSNGPIYAIVGFCSDACFHQFWGKVNSYPMNHEIGTDITAFNDNVVYAWNQAIIYAVANDFRARAQNAVKIHSRNACAFPWWDSTNKPTWAYSVFYNKAKLALAENLERCGRVQDAAKIFEELRMYDKSRELRERDRHIIVKNTNVSVNLNALLQQVKDGGIVAIFRCPFCGGKLKINRSTTVESLKICEHCGSEIQSVDLVDFLKTALT